MSRALLDAVSWFSFLRGVLSPETICREAKRLGYDTVVLADRNNLCALPEFLGCCRRYDLRAIIGVEICVGTESALLYSAGDLGYANLCRVITKRHCGKEFNLIESLLSDCEGLSAATDNVDMLMALFDKMPAFFRMRRPKRPPKEVKEHNLPCLVLPESVFNRPEDYHLHKLLRAMELNTTLSRIPQPELFSADSYLRPWSDIRRQFEAFPEHLRATEEFANSLSSRHNFGTWIFPRIHHKMTCRCPCRICNLNRRCPFPCTARRLAVPFYDRKCNACRCRCDTRHAPCWKARPRVRNGVPGYEVCNY